MSDAAAPSARCATHPEVAATGACSRCGDYLCRACEDPHHAGLCVRCGARLPRGLAWEDARAGGLVARFFATAQVVLLRPARAFPGPARVGPALGYASLCGLVVGGMLLTVAGLLLAGGGPSLLRAQAQAAPTAFAAALVLALVLPVPALLLWAALSAASFAIGLKAVGRRYGVLRVGLRACGYAQLLLLVCMTPPFLAACVSNLLPDQEPWALVTGVLWIVAAAAWPVLVGRHCRAAARGLGLPPARAALAALGPTALAALVGAWLTTVQLTQLGVS